MYKNLYHDLYLKHERMLDEEKKLRANLGQGFQDRMGDLQKEINDLKDARIVEVNRNQEVRNKIQE